MKPISVTFIKEQDKVELEERVDSVVHASQLEYRLQEGALSTYITGSDGNVEENSGFTRPTIFF